MQATLSAAPLPRKGRADLSAPVDPARGEWLSLLSAVDNMRAKLQTAGCLSEGVREYVLEALGGIEAEVFGARPKS